MQEVCFADDLIPKHDLTHMQKHHRFSRTAAVRYLGVPLTELTSSFANKRFRVKWLVSLYLVDIGLGWAGIDSMVSVQHPQACHDCEDG
ncbi:hypothetical protein QQP08_017165 [Theobroma cacao]|nr:hypothetical protein QQP08_017165 [Theobroma cacao]